MKRGVFSSSLALFAVTLGLLAYPAAGATSAQSAPTAKGAQHAHGPHIMPFNHPAPSHRTPAAPAGAQLIYNGGRVVSNVQVNEVVYGSGTYITQTTATGPSTVSGFFNGVTNSPYFDWLTEYNTNLSSQNPRTNQTIGRGTLGGLYTITPSSANNGSSIQDSNIQAELVSQINAGHLPHPTTDAAGNVNTLYEIFFRHGQSICMGTSCSLVSGGFCAYHGTIAAGGGLPELYYSVEPDLAGVSGCGTGKDFQNTTSVASHEMIETVTDAEVGISVNASGPPLAWYDQTNGEIGDICNGQQGTITGGDGVVYTVQQQWSNVANACVVTRNVAPPNDFSISASPTSLSLGANASGTSTISTAVTSGSAQAVNFSVTGLPSGATASFSPTSVTAGGTSTLTINSGSAAGGTYTLTITGTGASATHTTTLTLTLTAPPPPGVITNGGFETGNLSGWTSAGAAESVVSSGCHSGTYCARLGSTSATNGDSTIAQTFTVPSGGGTLSFWYKMTCPDSVSYDWADATLKDNTANTTATPLAKVCANTAWTQVSAPVTGGHSYTLTLLSHDDNYSADPTYTLYDDAAVSVSAPTNDFSISASPTSLSLAPNASGSSTISTAVTSGSAGTVALSVSGTPAGATASLSPTSVTAGGTSTLTINAGTAAAGSYTLTITGTEGSASHSTTVALTVTAAVSNDFSISASPTSLSLAPNASGSSTISTAVTSGSAGTVALSVSGTPAGATASLSPTSVTAGGTSTLTINAGTAAAGSYTLTITGTEGSASHSTTVALTVTAASGGGITNGGFETGNLSGWTSAGAAESVVSSGCHSGTYCAQLGSTSATNGDSTIAQTFTAPSAGGTLSFWYKMTCPDSVTYDWADATLKDNTANTTATPLAKVCTTNSWTQVSASVTGGHSYTLTLLSHDDNYAADPTYILFDDVAISGVNANGISNGGFETGSLSSWTSAGAAELVVSSGCHSGTHCAQLGSTSATNGDSTIAQTFTAPAGASILTFWYKMTCPDSVTYDWADATLKDNTANTTATPLAKVCTTNSWTQVSVAITAGHSYTLTLLSHDDNYAADPTYTLFDDVATS